MVEKRVMKKGEASLAAKFEQYKKHKEQQQKEGGKEAQAKVEEKKAPVVKKDSEKKPLFGFLKKSEAKEENKKGTKVTEKEKVQAKKENKEQPKKEKHFQFFKKTKTEEPSEEKVEERIKQLKEDKKKLLELQQKKEERRKHGFHLFKKTAKSEKKVKLEENKSAGPSEASIEHRSSESRATNFVRSKGPAKGLEDKKEHSFHLFKKSEKPSEKGIEKKESTKTELKKEALQKKEVDKKKDVKEKPYGKKHGFHFFKKREKTTEEKLKELKQKPTEGKPELKVGKAPKHEFLQNKLKKIKKKRRPLVQERKFKLKLYLDKAGLNIDPQILTRRIYNFAIAVTLFLSAYVIYNFAAYRGYSISNIVLSVLFLWTVVLAGIIVITWGLFYVILDLRIFKRKVEIEEVLPDYLQLTASNIKAGMTIDRALWYAVRPRFGVLASEIEYVAKQTMKGDDLKVALKRFADKYDSPILKRSISLLIEGIESGGEIGYLLNKISINIQENRIMKREMAANVTTYIIFISFATVAAAPALFGLSGVLIKVISSLGTSLGSATDGAAGAGFLISFSGAGISYTDFRIFAITSLCITSFFSSIIIATIMKGNAKEGIKYIPIFIIATVLIFLATDFFLGGIVGFVI